MFKQNKNVIKIYNFPDDNTKSRKSTRNLLLISYNLVLILLHIEFWKRCPMPKQTVCSTVITPK